MHSKLRKSCPTLLWPGELLEWDARPSCKGSSQPRDRSHVSQSPALAGRFFTTSLTFGQTKADIHLSTHKVLLPSKEDRILVLTTWWALALSSKPSLRVKEVMWFYCFLGLQFAKDSNLIWQMLNGVINYIVCLKSVGVLHIEGFY